MQLSKTGYYADFAIYAALVGTCAVTAALEDQWSQWLKWVGALAAGAALWTLIEYALHRFVLHRRNVFSMMHARHHASPRAFIGTPTWLSLVVLASAIFLPAWIMTSLNVASGVMAGVALGFLWYGILHHAIHHRRPRLIASLALTATQRHRLHHHTARRGNFGVTTPVWDWLFRTALETRPLTARTALRTQARV
jgi:sterol desaturase/sphingolipid hydroxylase (fatty acid hydroxylase superfamily)